jgi:hypothetical protein
MGSIQEHSQPICVTVCIQGDLGQPNQQQSYMMVIDGIPPHESPQEDRFLLFLHLWITPDECRKCRPRAISSATCVQDHCSTLLWLEPRLSRAANSCGQA